MIPAMPPRRVQAARRGSMVGKVLGGLLAGMGVAAVLAFWFSLPDPLFPMTYSAVLTSKDGQLLSARVAADGQWRFPPRQAVSPRFAEALIAFEDRRFRSHFGVDPVAVARAIRGNFQAGRIVSGASTLTMQVIRMARGNRPRTYWEKAIEAVLALRLELTHSKDEILALYASHAPFGGNVVGVRAAAWRYFGRPPEDLSWAENATLAVLPNSPGLVHPSRSRKALRERRDRLLRQLSEAGQLDAVELRLSMREPLPSRTYDYRDIRDDRVNTHFSLRRGGSRTFRLRFTTAYAGRFYAPGIVFEDMYDAELSSRTAGQWVEVIAP